MKSKKRFIEYDLMKVILISFVIIGHIIIQQLSNQVTGGDAIDYLLFQAALNDSKTHLLLLQVGFYFYQFHMKAFMALSGILFYLGINRIKKVSLFTYTKKQFIKLIIPYIFTTVLYLVPIRIIAHYSYPHGFLVGARDTLFLHENNYLWYLEALFLISVTVFFLEIVLKLDRCIVFSILFLLSLCRQSSPDYLYSALENGFWFYFGCVFVSEKESINEKIKKHPLAITLPSWIGLIFTRVMTESNAFNVNLIYYLTGFLGIIAVYSTSYAIAPYVERFPKIVKIIDMLAKNALYLYIFSDPLNGLVNYLSVHYMGLVVFSNNIYSIVLHIIKFAVNIIVPLIIGYLINRLKKAAKSSYESYMLKPEINMDSN